MLSQPSRALQGPASLLAAGTEAAACVLCYSVPQHRDTSGSSGFLQPALQAQGRLTEQCSQGIVLGRRRPASSRAACLLDPLPRHTGSQGRLGAAPWPLAAARAGGGRAAGLLRLHVLGWRLVACTQRHTTQRGASCTAQRERGHASQPCPRTLGPAQVTMPGRQLPHWHCKRRGNRSSKVQMRRFVTRLSGRGRARGQAAAHSRQEVLQLCNGQPPGQGPLLGGALAQVPCVLQAHPAPGAAGAAHPRQVAPGLRRQRATSDRAWHLQCRLHAPRLAAPARTRAGPLPQLHSRRGD